MESTHRKLVGKHKGIDFTIVVGERFIEEDDGFDYGVVTRIVLDSPEGPYIIETDGAGTGALVGVHEVSYRER